jgi:nucleoside-diphosphate-sugar epimerase
MVYGKVEASVVSERDQTNPLSLYCIHKLISEKYLQMYYKDFGIPFTILRLTNPYGPRQQIKHSKYSLVGWFIRQAMEGSTIKIFGSGTQLRDYIFVYDIIDAMLKCACTPEATGEIINVGSGLSTRFCDMVSEVVNCVGNGQYEFIPWPNDYEKIETGDISVNITKLQTLTSWYPVFSLRDGIINTFEYFKKHYTN